MANYLEDRDLYYQVVLSKGKGELTKKAENYFLLIAENTFHRFKDKFRYRNEADKDDCKQQGTIWLFEKWRGFNEKKYGFALPYFTEIFKRGVTFGFNTITNKKCYGDGKNRMVSMDSANEGRGFSNL